jgi:hypothetical protein
VETYYRDLGEHKEHYTAYWIELRYAELRSSRYLLRIEDTF